MDKTSKRKLSRHSPEGSSEINMELTQSEKKEIGKKRITTVKGFIISSLLRIKEADIPGFGAQLAFFFLLSLFPLLIFLMTLLPFLNLPVDEVYAFLKELLPEQVYTMIKGTLAEVLENRNGGLLSIGIVGTIWSASNGMNALAKSLNRSYDKQETRPFLIARFMSIVFTLMLILLIVVALVLPVFGEQIGVFLFSVFGLEEGFLAIWNQLRLLVPPALIFIVLTLMYWIMPNIKLSLNSVWVGALFSTITWLLVSYVFSFYINNFSNYSATYGSIGGIIILMLWLYVTGMILMVGGQLNAVVQLRKEKLRRK
ncbi:YihY/virulence factor BrkB family protein [Rummeliibacillus sp. JY-2-4R]